MCDQPKWYGVNSYFEKSARLISVSAHLSTCTHKFFVRSVRPHFGQLVFILIQPFSFWSIRDDGVLTE